MQKQATVRMIRKANVLREIVNIAVCQTVDHETYNLRVGVDTPADLREGEGVKIVWQDSRWQIAR